MFEVACKINNVYRFYQGKIVLSCQNSKSGKGKLKEIPDSKQQRGNEKKKDGTEMIKNKKKSPLKKSKEENSKKGNL